MSDLAATNCGCSDDRSGWRMWMRKQQQWLQFRLLARSDSSVLLRRMEQQRLWMRQQQ